ncbi:MAG: restriction endonuclease subunit S [Flavobacteriales bacterium]
MGINNWRSQPLKELCTRIGDGLHGTPKYSDRSDIPFINGNNLKNGQIIVTSNTNYVTEEEFEKNFIKLNHNSLLLSINGTLGSMAFYNDEVIMLGKSAAYLNFKTDINRFYYYYFQLPGVQTYFYNVATGSTIKNLSLKSIQDFEVPIPKENEYKAIAKVLSDLDAKIELNNKINTELEAMAKLIYDYWFVQFDFPDKNGKPYKSSGGKMVFNEELKREIPEGWDAVELSELESNIVTGKTPSTKIEENFNGDIPFICIGDVRGNMHITNTELTLSEKGANTQANKYIPEGSICVTCIASPGLVAFATRDSQTNQQLNTVVCEKIENRYFIYFYLLDYFKFAKAKTGNTFANMNKGDFSSIKVIKPNSEVLIEFSNKLESSVNKVLVNSKQNQKLSELRDWLLPMLMNGQVTVGKKD